MTKEEFVHQLMLAMKDDALELTYAAAREIQRRADLADDVVLDVITPVLAELAIKLIDRTFRVSIELVGEAERELDRRLKP